MEKTFKTLSGLMICVGLTACASYSAYDSSHQTASTTTVTATTATAGQTTNTMTTNAVAGNANRMNDSVGGYLRRAMDENDRSKLSHALDKSPGKVTHWVNQNSNTLYSVVSTKALTIDGSHCRKYNVTAINNGHTERTNGTACVDSDGAWKATS